MEELVQSIDSKIAYMGERYYNGSTMVLLNDREITYKGVQYQEYLIKSTVEEKREFIGKIAKSEHKRTTQLLLINLLNNLNLETQEELDELFKGQEELKSEEIIKNVIVMSRQ